MAIMKRVAAVATLMSFLATVGLANPGMAKDISQPTVTSAVLLTGTPNAPGFIPVPDQPPSALAPTGVDEAAPQPQDFATLAAAVAAQTPPGLADDELTCLAGAIYYESKGEPLSGQLAVAEVILNRAKAQRFGSTVCSVVTQPGQFSFVRGGRIPPVDPDRAAYRTAVAVAQVAISGDWESPAGDALYFHARRVSPGWHKTQVASIGNHVFYR